MEFYMIFLWLYISFVLALIGFIIGGLFSKDVNLPVIWACVVGGILMLVGFWVTST